MPLSLCATTVDSTRRELVDHGTLQFPIACYHDDLGRDSVPWHWHEEWEAVVVASGVCTVAAGREKYVVRAGEGFFVNSGVLHGCWDLEDSHCRFHSLVFHPRLVGGALDSVFHQHYCAPLMENGQIQSLHLRPEESWHRACLNAIEQAWQAGVQSPRGYEFRVRSHLSQLVDQLTVHMPPTPRDPRGKDLRDGQRIKQMLQFIHDHIQGDLTTADIAASASVSQSECLRCFRSTIGITPIAYVRTYRIQQASELLSATDLTVAQVAEQCGFTDLSYFTKTFREMKGLPPARFRRQTPG